MYPFDMAPAFWRQLVERGQDRIILLDIVREEIYKGEDLLVEWLRDKQDEFINETVEDEKVMESYSKIITDVSKNTQYVQSAKDVFADAADSWICAYGLTYKHVIVTNEKYEPEIKKHIKIPNICRDYDIEYINTLEFVREIGIRFE